MSISADRLVRVIPGVVGAGGSALEFNALFLTDKLTVPAGEVTSWVTPESVADYFGAESAEALMAVIYFLGYTNSLTKPSTLLIGQYVSADVAGWLRGAVIDNTLAEFVAITAGTLTISIDGVSYPLTGVDFSAEVSFSGVAAVLQADLITAGAAGVVVTYESDFETFLITSSTTGASSAVSFPASGDLIPFFKLAEDDGAVISAGLDQRTEAENMDAFTVITQNWVTFMHLFDQTDVQKFAFATWANSKNLGVRYVYSTWDSSATAYDPASETNLAYMINNVELSGTAIHYNTKDLAAFFCSYAACLLFTALNGRATAAYKAQGGLPISVTDDNTAAGLEANLTNFYGQYATANDSFLFYQKGFISGQYGFSIKHLCAIFLNNGFQLANISLLQGIPSIPYNNAGYDLIRAADQDVINAGLNFGAIRKGVTLSEAQVAQVNNAAGLDIAGTIESRGYYLQILDATAQVRAVGGTPPIKFWYTDGGDILVIEMGSTVIL